MSAAETLASQLTQVSVTVTMLIVSCLTLVLPYSCAKCGS